MEQAISVPGVAFAGAHRLELARRLRERMPGLARSASTPSMRARGGGGQGSWQGAGSAGEEVDVEEDAVDRVHRHAMQLRDQVTAASALGFSDRLRREAARRNREAGAGAGAGSIAGQGHGSRARWRRLSQQRGVLVSRAAEVAGRSAGAGAVAAAGGSRGIFSATGEHEARNRVVAALRGVTSASAVDSGSPGRASSGLPTIDWGAGAGSAAGGRGLFGSRGGGGGGGLEAAVDGYDPALDPAVRAAVDRVVALAQAQTQAQARTRPASRAGPGGRRSHHGTAGARARTRSGGRARGQGTRSSDTPTRGHASASARPGTAPASMASPLRSPSSSHPSSSRPEPESRPDAGGRDRRGIFPPELMRREDFRKAVVEPRIEGGSPSAPGSPGGSPASTRPSSRRKNKKQAAETVFMQELRAACAHEPEDRTRRDMLVITRTLRRLPFTLELEAHYLEDLAGCVGHRAAKRGELVCVQGEHGDAFYAILSGRLEVEVRGMGVVGALGAGQTFGELALLQTGTRNATVRVCSGQAELMVIRRADFQRILRGAEAQRLMHIVDFLSKLPLLRGWQRLRLKQLGSVMTRELVREGGIIAKQGQPLSHVTIIVAGSALLHHRAVVEAVNSWPAPTARRPDGRIERVEGKRPPDLAKVATEGRWKLSGQPMGRERIGATKGGQLAMTRRRARMVVDAVVGQLRSGAVFGLTAALDRQPCPFTVVAAESSWVLRLHSHYFTSNAFVEQDEVFENLLRRRRARLEAAQLDTIPLTDLAALVSEKTGPAPGDPMGSGRSGDG